MRKYLLPVLLLMSLGACSTSGDVVSSQVERFQHRLSGKYGCKAVAFSDSSCTTFGDLIGIGRISDDFEVVFNKYGDLVFRSDGEVRTFEGSFSNGGVYRYSQKEAKGVPLLHRSGSKVKLIVRRSPN